MELFIEYLCYFCTELRIIIRYYNEKVKMYRCDVALYLRIVSSCR